MMTDKVIEANNLVKRYGDIVALDHFNLSVEKGEVFALLGPNGSGKTTAINCILSLLKYDRGEIRLFGKKMTPTSYDLKRKIGVVFQNVAVINELTVTENINYFCSMYISDKVKRKELTDKAMVFTGLTDYAKFRPHQLSGGLLRRLNIACGIAHEPEVLFFDEPTVAVDPQSRNNILEGIKELNKKGATVVYTTHYMEEVEQIADRIMIMDAGKEIALGTKAELAQKIDTGETIKIEVTNFPEHVLSQIKNICGVRELSYIDEILEIVTFKDSQGVQTIGKIIELLTENQITYTGFHSYAPTLNELFLAITGKNLRD